MAYEIEWIEKTWILRVTYRDKLTYDDVEAVMKECLTLVEEHPTNFLVDFTNIKAHDPNIFRSTALIRLFRHANTKWFAFTGLSGILQMAAQILMRFSSFKAFGDEKEAVAFLREKAEEQKALAAKSSEQTNHTS